MLEEGPFCFLTAVSAAAGTDNTLNLLGIALGKVFFHPISVALAQADPPMQRRGMPALGAWLAWESQEAV